MSNILKWLAGPSIGGWARWIVILAIGAALTTAAMLARHAITTAFDRAEQKGAAAEQVKGLETVLEKVESANEASDDLRRDPAVRDAECLRNARNPESC